MKIKNYKKKCIVLSLILIVSGMLISAVGFGTEDFHYNRLKESASGDVWYQTIHTNDDSLWYGIKLRENLNLFVIGNSD